MAKTAVQQLEQEVYDECELKLINSYVTNPKVKEPSTCIDCGDKFSHKNWRVGYCKACLQSNFAGLKEPLVFDSARRQVSTGLKAISTTEVYQLNRNYTEPQYSMFNRRFTTDYYMYK